MNMYPQQRLSYKDKIKDDGEWGRKQLDYFLNYSYAARNNAKDSKGDYFRKLTNYKLYNNIIDQRDFERQFNPLGIDIGQFQDEIQPYNKTYTKINTLLGEESKQELSFKAVLASSEGTKSREREKTRLMHKFIQFKFQQELKLAQEQFYADQPKTLSDEQKQQLDQQFQQEFNNVLPPEEIDKYISTSYLDQREIMANNILKYLFKQQKVKEIKNDSFKHGLIAGEEFAWIGIQNGEPVVKIVNPLGMFYHKSPECKYIQNGLFAGFRTRMTAGELMDTFGRDMNDEQIKKIDGKISGALGMQEAASVMAYDQPHLFLRGTRNPDLYHEGSYGRNYYADFEVSHVEWKSQRKVGFLTSVDPMTGEEQMDLVDEDFKLPDYTNKVTERDLNGNKIIKYVFDNNTLVWDWVPEVWEGTRIEGDMYIGIRPKPNQYRSLDNPWNVKLGYHGVVYNNMNAESISPMDRAKPFQYLYFIVMHKMKKLIATDRGKTFHLDVTQIPKNIDMEKYLYYLNELDIDMYNPLQDADQPGAAQRGKSGSMMDRSNTQHINNYIQILDALDNQIGEAMGVTRAREGQTSPSEAVTNSQQNIIQSSHITEILFAAHNYHWEQVLNSLLETCMLAWEGKSVRKSYVLDDASLAVMDLIVEGNELCNEDFAVFVTNNAKDNKLFEDLRSLAQPLIQNDKAKFSDIIKLYKSVSIAELEREITQIEKKSEQAAQNAAQQQMQQQQQGMDDNKKLMMEKLDRDDINKELDRQNKLQVEQIKALGFAADKDFDKNGIPDIFEVDKFNKELNLKEKELLLRQKELESKSKHDAEKLDVEREKIAAQKQIANNKPSSK